MTQRFLKNSESPPYIQGKITVKDFTSDTGLYPDEVIKALCRQHQIAPEHKDSLFQVLEFAAKRYALQKYEDTKDLNPATVRKHLTSLKHSAKKLQSEMNRLPAKARDAFDKAELELVDELEDRLRYAQFGREAIVSRMEQAGTGKFRIIKQEPVSTGGVHTQSLIEYTVQKDIEAALKQIQLICDTGVSNLKPDKGGRPGNSALFIWVKGVSDFWVKNLKRPYKVDGYKGQVVTETGNFLNDCLKYLDPTAIEQLYSQMRRYRDKLSVKAA